MEYQISSIVFLRVFNTFLNPWNFSMQSIQTIDWFTKSRCCIFFAMKLKRHAFTETETYQPNLQSAIARSDLYYPKFDISAGGDLDGHLRKLIDVEENDDLFFSIYLDLSSTLNAEHQLHDLVRSILPTLDEESIDTLFQAESYILDIVGERIRDEHKGLAVHYRGGVNQSLSVIAFHLPVKPAICADNSPNILQLIEMRDSFDRYIVLISTGIRARIMEIVLGTVTREVWIERPKLHQNGESRWSREHYKNYKNEQNLRFIDEKIGILEDLSQKGSCSRLILAGTTRKIAEVEKQLPLGLRNRIIDICNLQVDDSKEKIVRETIQLYAEQENFESRNILERLEMTILSGGGAVIGLDVIEDALQYGVIETLIVTKSTDTKGRASRVFRHKKPDGNYLTEEKRRDRLIKIAIKRGLKIEFVSPGSFLDHYSGVGAILRYRGAEQAQLAPDEWLKQA